LNLKDRIGNWHFAIAGVAAWSKPGNSLKLNDYIVISKRG